MKTQRAIFTGILLAGIAGGSLGADTPTIFHDKSLEVALPPGWTESQQDLAGSDAIAGWESSDRKTSFYVMPLRLMNQGDQMRGALDRTIDNFDRDENWLLKEIGQFREIEINGLPATYVKVDLDLKSGDKPVPFVFHFAMVGGARSFYLLQSSTMKPVWKPREDELIRMIKSFRVLKEKE